MKYSSFPPAYHLSLFLCFYLLTSLRASSLVEIVKVIQTNRQSQWNQPLQVQDIRSNYSRVTQTHWKTNPSTTMFYPLALDKQYVQNTNTKDYIKGEPRFNITIRQLKEQKSQTLPLSSQVTQYIFTYLPNTFNAYQKISENFAQAKSLSQLTKTERRQFFQAKLLMCQESSPFFHKESCYDSCPNKTYSLAGFKLCFTCPFDCETCLDSNSCLSCNSSGHRQLSAKGRCVPKPGYYQSHKQIAYACLQSCGTCSYSGSNCTSCQTSFFLEGSSCKPCLPNCLRCQDAISCQSCIAGFTINDGNNSCFDDIQKFNPMMWAVLGGGIVCCCVYLIGKRRKEKDRELDQSGSSSSAT